MLPDVIVHLPEDRHLIIDSKVNLKAYERFCTLEPGAERDEELKKHVTAFRRHIDQLSRKEYDQRCQLNSVDYVLMFVPVEPAYTLAVAHDQNVFDEALRKNVVIVTPSTAHAMLRTIALIWRQENQSKNALEIAKKSGALYDKFVGFVQDLEDIGNKLQQTQNSYESAHRKLISGRGNLIRSSEAIRQLGAKNRKRLPGHILAASADDSFIDESAVDSTSGDSVSDGFEIDDSSIPDILEPRRPVGDDPQVTSDSIVCSAASASE
jgi:DNA recombination protein RmuC